jgi:predicted nucleic acid-binding protein
VILIDTSAWIEFFRGRPPLSDAVDDALDTNEATVCGPIITELRRGLKSAAERRKVLPLLDGCHSLADPPGLWEEAGDLGFFLARKGVTAKSIDLLVATYALSHGVPVLAADGDFADMKAAGARLVLALP